MKKTKWMAMVYFLSLATTLLLTVAVMANDVPRITTEQLKEMLGRTDVVIVDVRSAADWDTSDSKIQGAVREDPRKLSSWAEKYSKDQTLVFYCT